MKIQYTPIFKPKKHFKKRPRLRGINVIIKNKKDSPFGAIPIPSGLSSEVHKFFNARKYTYEDIMLLKSSLFFQILPFVDKNNLYGKSVKDILTLYKLTGEGN